MDDAKFFADCQLPVIRLHGLRPKGGCTCTKGKKCHSAGKHPYGKGWGNNCIRDPGEMNHLLENGQHLGVLLGPSVPDPNKYTRVIDLESDTPEAELLIESFGLDHSTCSWKSERGTHRLYLWEEGLGERSWIKHHGVEIRIGGVNLQMQTVLPPCGGREWINQVEPLPVPDGLYKLINHTEEIRAAELAELNAMREDETTIGDSVSYRSKKSNNNPKIMRGGIVYGDDATEGLIAAAVAYWKQKGSCKGADESHWRSFVEIKSWLDRINWAKCRPVKTEDEIAAIVGTSYEFLFGKGDDE